MGEIVNLRQARKRAARREREAVAEENRIRHGRTKAEKSARHAESERERRLLDGNRRDLPEDA